jgi:hypothetical protein
LLDFYGIAWDYEPTEFVLERDRVGNPVQAFRPDFYLPAYDLYLEVTTSPRRTARSGASASSTRA